jgi:histidinol phosphatase-like enzyme (inositol monophosphatase family)
MRPPEPFRRFALELAAASGDFILPFFGRPGLEVDLKSDDTPVTAADRGAEALMRDLILRRFPDHGIIGEEHGSDRPGAEWVWVLDPIDGTKSFMTACPLFGTLIALLHGGQPVLGIIHQPVLRQLVIGDGEVTTLNDRPVRVRPCAGIEAATLLTSDLLSPAQHQDGAAFDALARRARLVRTWGDCYGYLLVASGWADIMVDPIMSPWDLAALVPVIHGAGGVITDWHGGPAYPAKSAVAASAALHPAVLAALAPRP